MDNSTVTGGYFPALIAICILLTLTACLMTALPRTHASSADTDTNTSTPVESGSLQAGEPT